MRGMSFMLALVLSLVAGTAGAAYKAQLTVEKETPIITFNVCPASTTAEDFEAVAEAYRTKVADGHAALAALGCTEAAGRIVIKKVLYEGGFNDSAGAPHTITAVALVRYFNARMEEMSGVLFDAFVHSIGEEESV